jgi:hypothetical protein
MWAVYPLEMFVNIGLTHYIYSTCITLSALLFNISTVYKDGMYLQVLIRARTLVLPIRRKQGVY